MISDWRPVIKALARADARSLGQVVAGHQRPGDPAAVAAPLLEVGRHRQRDPAAGPEQRAPGQIRRVSLRRRPRLVRPQIPLLPPQHRGEIGQQPQRVQLTRTAPMPAGRRTKPVWLPAAQCQDSKVIQARVGPLRLEPVLTGPHRGGEPAAQPGDLVADLEMVVGGHRRVHGDGVAAQVVLVSLQRLDVEDARRRSWGRRPRPAGRRPRSWPSPPAARWPGRPGEAG